MSEEFYDTEIAPVLNELATKCKAKGLAFLAVVEYDSDSRGITQSVADTKPSICMMMAVLAVWARGNVDSFLINLIRYCNDNKIDTQASMFLRQWAKGE